MSLSVALTRFLEWLQRMPTHKRAILAFAITVFLVEVLLRTFAKKTRLYARWTHVFEAIGVFWTAVILSIVYFVSVAIISLIARLLGKDLLDRTLTPEATFWRSHEPNPLGPVAAARHQF